MPTILVVDDEVNVAKSIRRLLASSDFEVITAENGEEALVRLAENPAIGVVVSDQRMPKMTGSDLFAQMTIDFPTIRRILLTGYSDLDSIRDAVNKGSIFRFLLKPWDDDELLGCVEDAAKMYNIERENERLKDDLENINKNLENTIKQKTRVLNMNIRSLERFEKIVEKLPIGIVCVSDDGMVVLANHQFCKDFDFRSAVEGMPFKRVLPPEAFHIIEEFKSGTGYDISIGDRTLSITSSELEIDNTVLGKLYSIQVIEHEN